ncbi:hypothetical protein XPA_000715 [Xanthoria parietina]
MLLRIGSSYSNAHFPADSKAVGWSGTRRVDGKPIALEMRIHVRWVVIEIPLPEPEQSYSTGAVCFRSNADLGLRVSIGYFAGLLPNTNLRRLVINRLVSWKQGRLWWRAVASGVDLEAFH